MRHSYSTNRIRLAVPEPGEAVEDVAELTEGAEVWVNAFGRWRMGRVIKLYKVRAAVDYERNQQGDRDTKAFPLASIRKKG
jgi:hypothetical protein